MIMAKTAQSKAAKKGTMKAAPKKAPLRKPAAKTASKQGPPKNPRGGREALTVAQLVAFYKALHLVAQLGQPCSSSCS